MRLDRLFMCQTALRSLSVLAHVESIGMKGDAHNGEHQKVCARYSTMRQQYNYAFGFVFVPLCMSSRPFFPDQSDYRCVRTYLWLPLLPQYNIVFFQGPKQREVMKLLKVALTSTLALVSINYSLSASLIILTIDISLYSQGVVLIQLDLQGRYYPIRYLSSLQSNTKKKYNTRKLEYYRVLKVLKKVRQYLYSVWFYLELNIKTLIT